MLTIKKYVKETPTSWNDLWNEKYKGRVTLLNDSREVLGMALKKNGFSNSTKDDAQLKTAATDLQKLLPNLLAFDTDNIKQKFITEDTWIGTVWSGDATFIAKDNKDVGVCRSKRRRYNLGGYISNSKRCET